MSAMRGGSRWSNLPRAAAALLALLLSVVAGPRGNADDRRADGPRGGAALVAPIDPATVVVLRPAGIRPTAHRVDVSRAAVVATPVRRASVARPLRGTPVAARAP